MNRLGTGPGWRTATQHPRARLTAVALVVASAVVVVPAANAKGPAPAAKPDVAVTSVKIGRPYVLVASDGKAPEIGVRVVVRNVGHAAAPPSVTKVALIQHGREIDHQEVSADRILAGHAITQIAIFRDVESALGFLHALAHADANVEVGGGGFANDLKLSSKVPVIARRWLARGMEVEEKVPGFGFGGDEDDDTETTAVTFNFSHVASHPARFVYTASGEVTETTTVSGQCTAEGGMNASMTPWGRDSGLFISTSLTSYQATVRASLAAPFTIGETCQDEPVTVPRTVRFHDLLTSITSGGAPLSMSPTERKLHGHVSSGAISSLTYTWTILADVP
ncbi:MAG TPA: hypothetical protein VGF68_10745 [Solirubrobacteraceae bacterium]